MSNAISYLDFKNTECEDLSWTHTHTWLKLVTWLITDFWSQKCQMLNKKEQKMVIGY